MADLEKIASKLIESGKVRTAGTIEFVKDQGPPRRDLRTKDFKWSPDSFRELAKVLWAVQRAHSYAMAAYRQFSKMQSSEFSPDGLLGGRGYIQSIKEMRGALAQSVETLSSFSDTVHDEINADHWKSIDETSGTEQIVEDAERVKKNPEEFVEGEYEGEGSFSEEGEENEEEEEEDLENPDPDDMNPAVDGEMDEEEEEEGEGIEGGDIFKTSASQTPYDRFSLAFDSMLKAQARIASMKIAHPDEGMENVIDEGGMPGPRAYYRGPGETRGEFGDVPDPDPNLPVLCAPGQSSDTDNPGVYDTELIDYMSPGGTYQVNPNPTDGDDYRLSSVARRVAAAESYSWLPGADNKKSMGWYALGLTESDMKWMEAHCEPTLPKGIVAEEEPIDKSALWDGVKVT